MKHTRPLAAALAAAALIGAGLFVASPASAHDADLSGTAVCQDNGTQLVTVTGATRNTPGDLTGTVVVLTPEQQNLDQLAANASFSYDLTVPGDATKVETSARITWSDGHVNEPAASIDLPGDCTAPPAELPVVPLPPTVDCEGVSFPADTDQVTYTSPGPNTTGDGVTTTIVTATGNGVALTLDGEISSPTVTWALVHPTDCEPVTEEPPVTPEEPRRPAETPNEPTTPQESTDGSSDVYEAEGDDLAVTG